MNQSNQRFQLASLMVTTALLAIIVGCLNRISYAQQVVPEGTSITTKHMGVATCASSTCHGSTLPFKDSNVLRNEFRTWNESDPHALAYQTLLTEESINIAKKLGLKSAHTADACLSCHADNVPESRRGDEFKISDGVGCEACHGGAESYLESHTNATHSENLQAGLLATENPTVRATMCVSCHIGNESDRKITHTIMGAGHPRMSFELNTFSSIQPAHYNVDEDYIQRKGSYSELQIWAIGQLVASEQMLSNIQHFPRSGLFPELIHMDCLACHQSMSKINWQKNPLTNLPAGSLRFNDASLMMSYQLAQVIDAQMAQALRTNIQEFLNNGVAIQHSQGLTKTLSKQIADVRQKLESKPLKAENAQMVLSTLITHGLSASHQGYAAAEQSAMAINSVLRVINTAQIHDIGAENNSKEILRGVNTMFEGVNDAERYRQDLFINGLKTIRDASKQ